MIFSEKKTNKISMVTLVNKKTKKNQVYSAKSHQNHSCVDKALA